jgi:hypothetical protein
MTEFLELCGLFNDRVSSSEYAVFVAGLLINNMCEILAAGTGRGLVRALRRNLKD